MSDVQIGPGTDLLRDFGHERRQLLSHVRAPESAIGTGFIVREQ
jgi:hypothetical protein